MYGFNSVRVPHVRRAWLWTKESEHMFLKVSYRRGSEGSVALDRSPNEFSMVPGLRLPECPQTMLAIRGKRRDPCRLSKPILACISLLCFALVSFVGFYADAPVARNPKATESARKAGRTRCDIQAGNCSHSLNPSVRRLREMNSVMRTAGSHRISVESNYSAERNETANNEQTAECEEESKDDKALQKTDDAINEHNVDKQKIPSNNAVEQENKAKEQEIEEERNSEEEGKDGGAVEAAAGRSDVSNEVNEGDMNKSQELSGGKEEGKNHEATGEKGALQTGKDNSSIAGVPNYDSRPGVQEEGYYNEGEGEIENRI